MNGTRPRPRRGPEMFWNEEKREWQGHPDCKCGSGADWTERGINRPCVCNWLRPLDAKGQPISGTIIERIGAALLSKNENTTTADEENDYD